MAKEIKSEVAEAEVVETEIVEAEEVAAVEVELSEEEKERLALCKTVGAAMLSELG